MSPSIAHDCNPELLGGYRLALTRLLSADGYAARPYASAEDFLRGIGDLEDGCMILDINMPGANGFELQQLLWRKTFGCRSFSSRIDRGGARQTTRQLQHCVLQKWRKQ